MLHPLSNNLSEGIKIDPETIWPTFELWYTFHPRSIIDQVWWSKAFTVWKIILFFYLQSHRGTDNLSYCHLPSPSPQTGGECRRHSPRGSETGRSRADRRWPYHWHRQYHTGAAWPSPAPPPVRSPPLSQA